MNNFYHNYLTVFGDTHHLMKFEALMSSFNYRFLLCKYTYPELIEGKDEEKISKCNIYFSKSFINTEQRSQYFKMIPNPGSINNVEFGNKGNIDYSFTTEYAPCYGTILLLSKKFPQLLFSLAFTNPETEHEECCDISNGEQLELMMDIDNVNPYGYVNPESKVKDRNKLIFLDEVDRVTCI